MEESQITENNKLIAEFMGTNTKNPAFHKHGIKLCKYDSSWDWLMPVVDKIERLGYVFISDSAIRIIDFNKRGPTGFLIAFSSLATLDQTRMNATYTSCLQFINWYNQNKDI